MHPPPRLSTPPAEQPPLWIHLFVGGTLAGLVVLLLFLGRLYAGQNFWREWTPSPELRHPAYAEGVYSGDFFRTRANTWSNLAYVLVGLYALGLGLWDFRRQRPLTSGYLVRTPAFSFLFGGACIYLGLASGYFHASLTRSGQRWDVAAMYAPLLAILALGAGRWLPGVEGRRPTWPLFAGTAIVAGYLLFVYKWSMRSGIVLPNLILATGALTLPDLLIRRGQWQWRWLGFAMLTLAVARICWLLDVAGKFSGPDDWWQGHAIWHLLTAASLALLYFFQRSEQPVTAPPPVRA